jgi:hypothetical protein
MTCMTLFARPMAMATTQLTCAFHLEDASNRHAEVKAERTSLRMSWVVVTDEQGKRQLRMHWESVENC